MQTEVMLAKRLKAADFACAIAHAVDVLKNGGLVAFPTDTVYGLAAPAFEAASIERLYVVKGRNSAKAIAILLGGVQQLPQVTAHMTPLAARLAERFWPGPLTLVVPRHPALPTVLAPDATIGVRMPDHPVALALLRLAGPLAVTSANLTGGANACRAQEVLQQLNGRIHLLLDGGATPGGVPSTVVDCTGAAPAVLRAGPITQAQIDAALAE